MSGGGYDIGAGFSSSSPSGSSSNNSFQVIGGGGSSEALSTALGSLTTGPSGGVNSTAPKFEQYALIGGVALAAIVVLWLLFFRK
jgi:hypothetical protein